MESTAESSTGMSLTELEQVAREAGLDPELVRRAAVDLDTRVTDQEPNRCAGAPTLLRLERTIEGEVPADEYEPMVLEIQRVLGGVGQLRPSGRTLQFSMTGSGSRHASERAVQVTVTPRNGRTTIRIEEPLGPLAGALFGGVMGGMGGRPHWSRDRRRGSRISFANTRHRLCRHGDRRFVSPRAHDLRACRAKARRPVAESDVAPRRACLRDRGTDAGAPPLPRSSAHSRGAGKPAVSLTLPLFLVGDIVRLVVDREWRADGTRIRRRRLALRLFAGEQLLVRAR